MGVPGTTEDLLIGRLSITGDTLEAQLLDAAIVGLLDRNEIAADAHQLSPVRGR
jgi:hypothetical protein